MVDEVHDYNNCCPFSFLDDSISRHRALTNSSILSLNSALIARDLLRSNPSLEHDEERRPPELVSSRSTHDKGRGVVIEVRSIFVDIVVESQKNLCTITTAA
jgi:hypothetical protein